MSQAVTTQDQSNGLLSFIERASRDPEFDVAKFESLLRMQREIVTEQERRDFNRAMSAAQTEMMPIIRDATNPHTNSRYARLETIDREMRPIYTRHGFSVRFGSAPSPREGWIRIVCTVSHTGGYSETNYLDAPPDQVGSQGRSSKTPVQAVGSSVTYLRRYLLAMVFNIVLADDDDDGEAARRPPPTVRDRQADAAYGARPNGPGHPLDEPNGPQWLKNLQALLDTATTLDQVAEIGGHPSVRASLAHNSRIPKDKRDEINAMLLQASDRVRSAAAPGPGWEDPMEDLLIEVQDMDQETIANLAGNAAWRARVRDAAQIPQDEDRVNEAIAARKAELLSEQQRSGKGT